MKKQLCFALSACFLLSSFPLAGCTNSSRITRNANTLYVASWDEYIDEGGSFYQDDDPDMQDFKDWYFELTGIDLNHSKPLYEEFEEETGIHVEYVTLQDNETMYNKIKMGDTYDLLCPSEYMIMKLAAEQMLEKYPASFFDTTNENNYYAKNVSPYIQETFETGKLENGESWAEYAAGYMWGSTGFVFNPNKLDRDLMNSWNCVTSDACNHKVTAKDNVRDSYFMGLGMHYEAELLELKAKYERGEVSRETYRSILDEKMNDTQPATMNSVKKDLIRMRKNLYGLETDEGKFDIIRGRFDASYQWSGDAVYILDEAESSDLELEYSIPSAASNLFFDGWVMMKGANVDAATAFVNFLSRPENVIRNMYYIGYTSCIGGNEVFDYISYIYGAEDDDDAAVSYDLSYFFGEGRTIFTPENQTRRQLFAQYPDTKTIDRLVVMKYFDKETNERANRMWINIK